MEVYCYSSLPLCTMNYLAFYYLLFPFQLVLAVLPPCSHYTQSTHSGQDRYRTTSSIRLTTGGERSLVVRDRNLQLVSRQSEASPAQMWPQITNTSCGNWLQFFHFWWRESHPWTGPCLVVDFSGIRCSRKEGNEPSQLVCHYRSQISRRTICKTKDLRDIVGHFSSYKLQWKEQ